MSVNSYSSSVEANTVIQNNLHDMIYHACKNPEIRRIFAQQVNDICSTQNLAGANTLYILVISIIVSMFIGVVLHTWYQNNLLGKTISVTQEEIDSVTQEEIDSAKVIVRKHIASASTFSFQGKSREETLLRLTEMLTTFRQGTMLEKLKVVREIQEIHDLDTLNSGEPTKNSGEPTGLLLTYSAN